MRLIPNSKKKFSFTNDLNKSKNSETRETVCSTNTDSDNQNNNKPVKEKENIELSVTCKQMVTGDEKIKDIESKNDTKKESEGVLIKDTEKVEAENFNNDDKTDTQKKNAVEKLNDNKDSDSNNKEVEKKTEGCGEKDNSREVIDKKKVLLGNDVVELKETYQTNVDINCNSFFSNDEGGFSYKRNSAENGSSQLSKNKIYR
eukprot:Pgem_evm2s14086